MKLILKLRDVIRPRKNVLREVGIEPGFRVLDFGCGPGSYIPSLEKLVGPSGKIYALDVHPLALEDVKALAAREGYENIETILSDGATGLPDGSVDAALLHDVFHHLAAPDEVLKELHRVLKHGGILSMSDHHMKEDDIISGMTGSGLFRLLPKCKKAYKFSKVIQGG
jgi:ubiquinone/menaquinone biosynthesis C-methylase UbiE